MTSHELAKKLLELPDLEVWFQLPCEEGAIREDIVISEECSHACQLDLDEALGNECVYDDNDDEIYSPIIFIRNKDITLNYEYLIDNLLKEHNIKIWDNWVYKGFKYDYTLVNDNTSNQITNYELNLNLVIEKEEGFKRNDTLTFTSVSELKDYLTNIGYFNRNK